MARLIVADSGAVEREIRRLIVTDSGAVERELKRLFVVDAGGTSRLVFEAVAVAISNQNLDGTATSPGSADARYQLTSGGDVQTRESPAATFTDVGDWITPKSAAGSDYEARMTKQSGNGTLDFGTEATWESLGTTRTWGISHSSIGTARTYVGLCEIRRASDGTVVASATIDFSALVSV